MSAAAAAASSSSTERYDVIVVGAGIMGSCAAHAAASKGARVLLLEQFDLLHHRGSSHGESRTIRSTYPQAHYPPMVRLSRRLWDDAQLAAGYRVLTPTPHLDMGPRNDPSLLAAIAHGAATDLSSMPPPPWAEVFNLPHGWTAATSELGGVMKATKAVAMFQSLASNLGAVLRDNTEVIAITTKVEDEAEDEIISIKTADGKEFHGGKCIITAGAWSRKLLQNTHLLPVQPLHTLICYWKVKPGMAQSLTTESGFPTFASYGDPYIYSTPSMEYPGLIKIAMHGGAPCDPDGRDWHGADDEEKLVRPVAKWIEQVMPEHVETAGGPVIRQPCMYSMTPDEDFVIDFLGGEFGEDVVVGAGFSGHGFKMGPAVGRILAEMAMDGEARTAVDAGVDLRHFSIARFLHAQTNV